MLNLYFSEKGVQGDLTSGSLCIPSYKTAKGTFRSQTSIYMLILDSKLSMSGVIAEDLNDEIFNKFIEMIILLL
jgi:hypothetical protein